MHIEPSPAQQTQPAPSPRFAVLRERLGAWYKQLQQSLAMNGWVLLGLGLIAFSAGALLRFPSWFGPFAFGTAPSPQAHGNQALTRITKPHVPLAFTFDTFVSIFAPAVAAMMCYLLLTVVYPRLFRGSKQRRASIFVPFAALVAIGLVVLFVKGFLLMKGVREAGNQILFSLGAYAVVAHAHVTFDKRGRWLAEIVVAITVLLLIVFISVPEQDRLLLQAPQLGIQQQEVTALFQFGSWLLGLICLHIFLTIGLHERSARLRSETLVQQLTLAQQELRASALRVEELATMRERARVAREVHDTLAQGLAAIKMHLETGIALLHEHSDPTQTHLERARDLAGQHLDEARSAILELRADVLGGQTLPAALAALAATWQPQQSPDDRDGRATFCLSGRAETSPVWLALAPAVKLACYRVAQEALSNASKHGQAGHVEVELSIEQDELCLTITDDGAGFDPSAIHPGTASGGFGITGMHERMKMLNGSLEILSVPGAGTQVIAMLPLVAASTSMEPSMEQGAQGT